MKRNWWKESIVYQIYPRSFKDSNGDGIGDIKGIIEKLDYLKELGVNVLWLSPVFESPLDDNGYDISDYRKILGDYGTMADFNELIEKAHEKGLKILMDLVVNHTSDEHSWFVESKKSKENPYRDYYIWRYPKAGKEPNNWGATFGGSAWEYDNRTGMYYLHCFSKKQPDLNWENEAVRNDIYEMMNWWCEKGIDGFRMDVISMISKDQSFPEGKEYGGLYGDGSPYYMNGPRIHEYLQEMNREVLARHDIMTVGETAGVTIEEAKKYAGEDANELNMVFQFEHVSIGDGPYGKWTTNRYDFREYKKIMIKWQEELQGKAWNSLYLGNHDQPRSVSRFGDDSEEYREISAKMLATCIHMMQGTPYIYQGEEIGMTNAYFEDLTMYRDIESLQYYEELTGAKRMEPEEMMECLKLRSRDNARTPMQWNNKKNGGFTEGTPWINLNSNYSRINVERQMKERDSVFQYYKKLIRLRKENEVIVYGHFTAISRADEKIFAFKRELDEKRILVLCNYSKEATAFTIPEEFAIESGKIMISNYLAEECKKEMTLRPYEAVVFAFGS
ncbi:oligo-1,6-glucosidase [Lachnospiraceae bacterium PF1-21]|uniref:Alpha-glucosidase n=1 Tax=Ohessyouella blattaphilus TaxID=2949333 RepID=A0ABT1EK30_9FIRM|nr:alpha-glucosidase [Ohessyouella blattaphilus]MCP1109667.1 alpha-glucosidase [Ohessyouella blattaphilus]MCR8563061.1 alpha-glucosidase [Ohessyouella blattaphilus]MDL2251185.1 alpha-glucosidase [Lachnospiraceae bacterium OttesenSCG-928-J05]